MRGKGLLKLLVNLVARLKCIKEKRAGSDQTPLHRLTPTQVFSSGLRLAEKRTESSPGGLLK